MPQWSINQCHTRCTKTYWLYLVSAMFPPLFEVTNHLFPSLEEPFKKSIRYLRRYQAAITRAFELPYSNRKLEGKNHLIKVIQRVSFGFRSFKTLKKRVFIQQEFLCIK